MIADFKEKAEALAGKSILRKSALRIRDGDGAFERVLGGGKYKTVLEIGTYRGVSAAYMAGFCEKIITIDLKEGKIERNLENFDRFEFWRAMGVLEKIELHLVADDLQKAALVNSLEFDLAFLDGAHDATIKNDFALVRRCGSVLFHDAEKSSRSANVVHEFIATLPKEQVEFMGIFALWTA